MTEYYNIPFEMKDSDGLQDGQFEGHGAVFNNVDRGGDIIVPGAFTDTLKEHADAGTLPQMFWMHQMDQIPGKWLDVSQDKKGLAVRGELVDTSIGRDIKALFKAKAVRGLSIGYSTNDFDFTDAGIRLLKAVTVHEVSIVSLAMNPLAAIESAKARLSSRGEYVPRPPEFESILREVGGLSKSVAKGITSKVYALREAGRLNEDEELEELKSLLANGNERMGTAVLESMLRKTT